MNTVSEYKAWHELVLYIVTIVNCGVPISPMDGYLGNLSHTREGATVTYQCNVGYRPSTVRLSQCTDITAWVPAPEDHNCTLVIGIVMIFALFHRANIFSLIFSKCLPEPS